MNTALFRKTSIDRVNSPEQLNQYIRVARPGVWITLSAVVLLLAGVVIWGVFGTIETTVHTYALVENGKVVCYLEEEDAALVEDGMPVLLDDVSGRVLSVSAAPVQIDAGANPYLMHMSGFSAGDFRYVAEIEAQGLADGVYQAKITVESVHPLVFVTH